jgi:AraC family transcriptional regulator
VAAVSPSAEGAARCHVMSSGSGPSHEGRGARDGLKLSPRPADSGIPFTKHDQQISPGIVATLVRMKDPVSYEFRFEGADCCIALLDLYRADGETRLDGHRLSHVKDMRDRLTFLPSGCAFSGWTRLARAGEFFAVRIARETASQRGIDLEQLPPRHGFSDQALRTIMRRLRALFDDASLNRPGYAETLADLLCFELERAVSQKTRPGLQQGGLTARQVRIITEYMEDHLAEKISIADLAALLGLTRFHFIRSFQQSVGLPPHQFLIRRRVERAREILNDNTLSIATVAGQSGFRGTVQLTRAFRRVVGTTPSRYRRELN